MWTYVDEIACQLPRCKMVEGFGFLPNEYQGWFMVMIMIFGFCCLVYAILYIEIPESGKSSTGEPEEKTRKNKGGKGWRK